MSAASKKLEIVISTQETAVEEAQALWELADDAEKVQAAADLAAAKLKLDDLRAQQSRSKSARKLKPEAATAETKPVVAEVAEVVEVKEHATTSDPFETQASEPDGIFVIGADENEDAKSEDEVVAKTEVSKQIKSLVPGIERFVARQVVEHTSLNEDKASRATRYSLLGMIAVVAILVFICVPLYGLFNQVDEGVVDDEPTIAEQMAEATSSLPVLAGPGLSIGQPGPAEAEATAPEVPTAEPTEEAVEVPEDVKEALEETRKPWYRRW